MRSRTVGIVASYLPFCAVGLALAYGVIVTIYGASPSAALFSVIVGGAACTIGIVAGATVRSRRLHQGLSSRGERALVSWRPRALISTGIILGMILVAAGTWALLNENALFGSLLALGGTLLVSSLAWHSTHK